MPPPVIRLHLATIRTASLVFGTSSAAATDYELGWLGRSAGPRRASRHKDPRFAGRRGDGSALAERISGQVKTLVTTDGVRVERANAERPTLRFVIGRIPTPGPDLFVTVRMRGDPSPQYPREMARFAEFGASGGMVDLMAGEPLATGMKLRGSQQEVPLDAIDRRQFAAPTRYDRRPNASHLLCPPAVSRSEGLHVLGAGG